VLLAILGAAQHHGSRVAVMRELVRALKQRGEYACAVEELTPISGDPIAAVPVIVTTLSTLLWPPLWRSFHSGAVAAYALAPGAWDEVLSASANDAPHADCRLGSLVASNLRQVGVAAISKMKTTSSS